MHELFSTLLLLTSIDCNSHYALCRDCCWGIFFPDGWILLDWMFVNFTNKIDVGWWKSVVVINSCFIVWEFLLCFAMLVPDNYGWLGSERNSWKSLNT